MTVDVGVTDKSWYGFLARLRPDEVNFWRPSARPLIGCIVLNEPFFFQRDKWIPVPNDWARNIVSGKGYSTDTRTGQELWGHVRERLVLSANRLADEIEGYSREYLRKARLGQGAFRLLVTGAYRRCCAVTQDRTLPVLQAAHIKPVGDSGPNRVENGLLLRSDLHILFDRGYITVTPEHCVEVSRRIKDQFDNGRAYYGFHGSRLLVLPSSTADWPNRDFLDWHNTKVYRG